MKLCVYCGSNAGASPQYAKAAQTLGECMVERHIDLVYGGADIGLMGILANTILAGGGAVEGVIPAHLAQTVSHNRLTQLHVVDSMHERKTMMYDMADGILQPIKITSEIVENWPEVMEIIYNSARQFEKVNHIDRAVEYYKRLFQIDAGYSDIVDRLGRLT